jgi:hypothetical protein
LPDDAGYALGSRDLCFTGKPHDTADIAAGNQDVVIPPELLVTVKEVYDFFYIPVSGKLFRNQDGLVVGKKRAGRARAGIAI